MQSKLTPTCGRYPSSPCLPVKIYDQVPQCGIPTCKKPPDSLHPKSPGPHMACPKVGSHGKAKATAGEHRTLVNDNKTIKLPIGIGILCVHLWDKSLTRPANIGNHNRNESFGFSIVFGCLQVSAAAWCLQDLFGCQFGLLRLYTHSCLGRRIRTINIYKRRDVPTAVNGGDDPKCNHESNADQA